MRGKLFSKIKYSLDKYSNMLKGWTELNASYIKKQKINKSLTSSIPVSADQLTEYVHRNAEPVFVLSTGRCGTKFVTQILDIIDHTSIHHSTSPILGPHSNHAFHNHQEYFLQPVFDSARYEMIRNEFLIGNQFIETNHRISFFAHAISELFPKSKFIHLYRNAFEFAQSALSRNWYSYTTANDEGRLMLKEQWANLDQVEKIASLWCETNLFIKRFGNTISKDRYFTISSDALFNDLNEVKSMLRFVDQGHEISEAKIRKKMQKRINAQPEHRKKKMSEEDLASVNDILKKYDLTPDADFR